MNEIQAPHPFRKETFVFLGGSIEMGNAEKWQSRLISEFSDCDITFLNPRRDDFDRSMVQRMENNQFMEQVSWELDALDFSDLIIFYFDPNTKAPITLLELGLHAKSRKVIVCCPDKFWRRGNVEIICGRYDIPLCNSFEELCVKMRYMVQSIIDH